MTLIGGARLANSHLNGSADRGMPWHKCTTLGVNSVRFVSDKQNDWTDGFSLPACLSVYVSLNLSLDLYFLFKSVTTFSRAPVLQRYNLSVSLSLFNQAGPAWALGQPRHHSHIGRRPIHGS